MPVFMTVKAPDRKYGQPRMKSLVIGFGAFLGRTLMGLKRGRKSAGSKNILLIYTLKYNF
jgi:hypothetical protein